MTTAFDVGRNLTMVGINCFFSSQQRAVRSPGFNVMPNTLSDTVLGVGEIGWHYAQRFIPIEDDQFKLALRIALPIVLGFAAGYTTCVSNKYRIITWLEDFAVSATTHAILIEIRNRADIDSYKKGLFIDVLFAAKMCASFALDKSRNSSLSFTGHCAHVILTTFIGRIATHIADTYRWYEKDTYVRDTILRKVIFIALIFIVQSPLKTRLQYSWKVIGVDFFVSSFATYILFSHASSIV